MSVEEHRRDMTLRRNERCSDELSERVHSLRMLGWDLYDLAAKYPSLEWDKVLLAMKTADNELDKAFERLLNKGL